MSSLSLSLSLVNNCGTRDALSSLSLSLSISLSLSLFLVSPHHRVINHGHIRSNLTSVGGMLMPTPQGDEARPLPEPGGPRAGPGSLPHRGSANF